MNDTPSRPYNRRPRDQKNVVQSQHTDIYFSTKDDIESKYNFAELSDDLSSDSQYQSTKQFFNLPEVLTYCLSADLTTLLYCSDNAWEVLGCRSNEIRSNGAFLLRHIHSDDRFRVLNTLEEALIKNKPISIAYRWTLPSNSRTVLLFNHAAPAHSDQGEVISGIIARIDPTLSREISIVSGYTPEAYTSNSDANNTLTIFLDEQLMLISDIPQEPKNNSTLQLLRKIAIEILSNQEVQPSVLHNLFQKVHSTANKASKSQIFVGSNVILLTMRLVSEDTFTPYYQLSLSEISEQFLEQQELRSLRSSHSIINFLKKNIIPLEEKLAEMQKYAKHLRPSHSRRFLSLTSQATTICKEITKVINRDENLPYLNGGQIIFKTLSEISSLLPSRVKMQVEIPTKEFWIWRAVANYIDKQLSELGDWLLSFAKSVKAVTVSLEHIDNSAGFSLNLNVEFKDKSVLSPPLPFASNNSNTDKDSYNINKELSTTSPVTGSFTTINLAEGLAYKIQYSSAGCFSEPPA